MAELSVPAVSPAAAPRESAVQRWEPGKPASDVPVVREIGGRKDGPEPTRYGDWEKNGRCIDF